MNPSPACRCLDRQNNSLYFPLSYNQLVKTLSWNNEPTKGLWITIIFNVISLASFYSLSFFFMKTRVFCRRCSTIPNKNRKNRILWKRWWQTTGFGMLLLPCYLGMLNTSMPCYFFLLMIHQDQKKWKQGITAIIILLFSPEKMLR